MSVLSEKPHIIGQQDLFTAGSHGCAVFRIPAILATTRGSLLAFCEGRRHGVSDSGDIDIVMRKSRDDGRTWDELRIVADAGSDTIGNPCPVVDRTTGTVWMAMSRNNANHASGITTFAQVDRTVWLMKSDDDGETWSEPVEITGDAKRDEWVWYATGPGHGIQLSGGRLLLPCDHSARPVDLEYESCGSHVVLSDDGGAGWYIGGSVEGRLNECQVVELRDGTLIMSIRSLSGRSARAFATSIDGGITWSNVSFDDRISDPNCQGSLLGLADGTVAFSNPAGPDRSRMTLRLSYDDCVTWPIALVLTEGPSAYSDLAQAQDEGLCCLYEAGDERPYERIMLAMIRI